MLTHSKSCVMAFSMGSQSEIKPYYQVLPPPLHLPKSENYVEEDIVLEDRKIKPEYDDHRDDNRSRNNKHCVVSTIPVVATQPSKLPTATCWCGISVPFIFWEWFWYSLICDCDCIGIVKRPHSQCSPNQLCQIQAKFPPSLMTRIQSCSLKTHIYRIYLQFTVLRATKQKQTYLNNGISL